MIPISDYDYHLPSDRIAQLPADKRESSRLMILDKTQQGITHKHFYDIIDELQPGDLLVLNNTKVIPARLYGQKETGAKVEVFLLEMLSENKWEVLVKPGKRVKEGAVIVFDEKLSGQIVSVLENGKRIIEFNSKNVIEELERIGNIPLPPYIKYDKDKDAFYKARYQTVFAEKEGAVAAPTAGLHFSTDLLDKIKAKGVSIEYVTLYVGIGTFKPIACENVLDHKMHKERYELPAETINAIKIVKDSGRKVIAVGTTVVRVLEGVYKKYNKLKAGSGDVDLFIYPGFKFNVVDNLLTNFHLPKSSLLLLVSALAGRDFLMKSYEQGVEEKYRFFSFGDAMFIK